MVRLEFMEYGRIRSVTARRRNSAVSALALHPKAWTVALAASVLTGSIFACSGVGPPEQPVVFGDQTNIVIWDEANHIEHFIRNANFRSGANNFGFIAPTPGRPELHEASNQAFILSQTSRRELAMAPEEEVAHETP
jgi:hypothetical protein